MKDRIQELLAAGVPQGRVATAVGCDESYISQLMAEEEFREKVQAARAENAVEKIKHDSVIEEVEETALKRVRALIPMETNILRAAKIFQVMNSAKKSNAAASGLASQPATMVSIQLPAEARVSFILSTDRQVIEIDGRSMTTLPSHTVEARMRERKAGMLLENKSPAIPSLVAQRLNDF